MLSTWLIIAPEDFVVSGRLDHLLDRMVLSQKNDPFWIQSTAKVKAKIQYEDLAVKHRKEVMKLVEIIFKRNLQNKIV